MPHRMKSIVCHDSAIFGIDELFDHSLRVNIVTDRLFRVQRKIVVFKKPAKGKSHAKGKWLTLIFGQFVKFQHYLAYCYLSRKYILNKSDIRASTKYNIWFGILNYIIDLVIYIIDLILKMMRRTIARYILRVLVITNCKKTARFPYSWTSLYQLEEFSLDKNYPFDDPRTSRNTLSSKHSIPFDCYRERLNQTRQKLRERRFCNENYIRMDQGTFS